MLKSLRNNTPITDSYYYVARFAAWCGGFWPTTTRSSLQTIWFVISLVLVTVGGVLELIYGIVYLNDFMRALEAFCPAVTELLSAYKMFIFHLYYKRFAHIVIELESMITADKRQEKQRVFQTFSAMANVFSFLVFAAGQTTNVFFITHPPLVDAYRWWIGKPPLRLLPLTVFLPEVFLNYPIYPLTFIALAFAGIMTVMAFSGSDGFFLSTCYYFAALFYEMQLDIEETFGDLSNCEYANAKQNLVYRKRLCQLVVRHNRIMDLCDEFTTLFRAIVFLHFMSAALVMCLSILDLMLNSASMGVAIYVSYSVAAGSQYLLYCAGGSKVEETSHEIADTLYNTEWYKCDLCTRKMILIMLHRSQRAKTIDVPFFSLSFPSFNALVTKTGSYITLLKTFL